MDRLADLAEPITRPRAVAYVVRDGEVLVVNHRPDPRSGTAGLQVPGGTVTRGGRELHHFPAPSAVELFG